ncbi:S-layer protein, partial [Paenarthrobacter aurescens]|nr:S-layer protein [Paenarthrobacter aurescens]
MNLRWQLAIDQSESASISSAINGSLGRTQVSVPTIAVDPTTTEPITFSYVNISTQFNAEIS